MKKRTFNKENNIRNLVSSVAKSQANFKTRAKLSQLDEEQEEIDLNAKLMKYKELEYIYQKTGIKPIYLSYVLVLLLVLIIFGVWDDLLTCVIGVFYPVYANKNNKVWRKRNNKAMANLLVYILNF